ncbi:Coatomer beta subunit [Trema orientale]|uniref:Coatomer beta subunit n=1 Tax=Trema orientale TaxID=63057 RepID=A0A2P5F5X4_TREOI|nr:Coatomer beta subunit [Trema orientale]
MSTCFLLNHNTVLYVRLQILKHDLPRRLRDFIPLYVASVSATEASETMCENFMLVLNLLLKEVYDIPSKLKFMTDGSLEESIEKDSVLIYEFCFRVLIMSGRTELTCATLSTLDALLLWMPLDNFFESSLLDLLLENFRWEQYSNIVLRCLIKVAVLEFPDICTMQDMYSKFMKVLPRHIRTLETISEVKPALLMGLEYLISISYVDDIDVYKGCSYFWNLFALVLMESQLKFGYPMKIAKMMGLKRMPWSPGMGDRRVSRFMMRKQLYVDLMSKLRMLMISRMAKPEEVLIVEDRTGNIVCETIKYNDVIESDKIKDIMIYLSHLYPEDTEMQVKILNLLGEQLNSKDLDLNNFNRLCWAIGSISGSMMEEQENNFLAPVIDGLLNFFGCINCKNFRSVIAINIMYVVGQYPRLLRARWELLKTVVNILFEFMRETHPGVQAMACDTFLKIVQGCKHKFVIVQVGENKPLISELLSLLPDLSERFELHQIHTVFESFGHMIQTESDSQKKDAYLKKLMKLPNQKWGEIIGLSKDYGFLKDHDLIRKMLKILQINTSVASSIGEEFESQFFFLFDDMCAVYRKSSLLICSSIQGGGSYASETSNMKLLRYKDATAKDEVLDVFSCSSDVVTKNFDDYPEHCVNFFSLARALVAQNCPALVKLPFQKRMMDSIIWALRRTETNIAETGLNLLLDLLKMFQKLESCNQFYQTYYLTILQEIFAVLTDTFHILQFELHVMVLQHLFCLVVGNNGLLTEPLWDADILPHEPFIDNEDFVRDYTEKLIAPFYKQYERVSKVVDTMFRCSDKLGSLKRYMRSFLFELDEFSLQDVDHLVYQESYQMEALNREKRQKIMLFIMGH